MRDAIVEEILRNKGDRPFREEKKPMLARPRTRQSIPAANRYPHSAERARLERDRQPWNRDNGQGRAFL
jgi:hypothetical protein